MARRQHHYRRRTKEPAELNVTTFLNLMVILVPFLLITAVFSRVTIVELSLPSAAGGQQTSDPGFRVEVIVRDAGLQVTNGTAVIAGIPMADGEYDLDTLGGYIRALKEDHPNVDAASVLLEPNIAYDHLIQVMDVVRSMELPDPDDGQLRRVALFPEISVGDAP